jgi:hypothetical protein
MNPVSVGLTVAWLDAFREMGTRKTLADETKLPGGERTLSETIASALRAAGAEREQYIDPARELVTADAIRSEAVQPAAEADGRVVDRLA